MPPTFSPLRRPLFNRSILDTFSDEIFALIFEDLYGEVEILDDSQEAFLDCVTVLSSVCKRFRRICLPHFFRKGAQVGPNLPTYPPRIYTGIDFQRTINLLKADPALTSYIHSVDFGVPADWYPISDDRCNAAKWLTPTVLRNWTKLNSLQVSCRIPEDPEGYPNMPSSYEPRDPRHSLGYRILLEHAISVNSLTSLSIAHIHDLPFLSILSSAVSLRTLDLAHCRLLQETLGDVPVCIPSLISFKTKAVDNIPLSLMHCDTLRDMRLIYSRLRKDTQKPSSSCPPAFPSLVTLAMSHGDYDQIQDLAELVVLHAPSIEVLEFPGSDDWNYLDIGDTYLVVAGTVKSLYIDYIRIGKLGVEGICDALLLGGLIPRCPLEELTLEFSVNPYGDDVVGLTPDQDDILDGGHDEAFEFLDRLLGSDTSHYQNLKMVTLRITIDVRYDKDNNPINIDVAEWKEEFLEHLQELFPLLLEASKMDIRLSVIQPGVDPRFWVTYGRHYPDGVVPSPDSDID